MDGLQKPAVAGGGERVERARVEAGAELWPRSGGPLVTVARSLAELEPLATRWDELAHHPWSDRGLFATLTAGEADFLRPHVLAVGEPGRPPALVVAGLRDERVRWQLGGRTLVAAHARVLRVPTGGLLALAASARVHAAAASLRASIAAGEADLVYLHEVPRDEPLVAELTRPREPGRDPAPRVSSGWVLPLATSFEAFRRGLSSKARSNLNHATNSVQRKLGALPELRVYSRPEELDELVQASEAVARTTYHRRAGFGFTDTPAARATLLFALERGWQRAHVLLVDGRPIAFEHGLVYRGTYFGRHTGFDPAFAELRPGVHLLLRVLERLCEERAAERLDLGVMDTQLKRTLGGVPEERLSLYLFGPSLRARWLQATRALVRGTEEGARRLLGARLARRLRRAGG